ncbi:PilZ domain-containing protein [Paramagnetospirillum kuznetsovii]|uniref:PilZ domain-containing protein n=1 Tax=Paramagnetospirillum kuznetsovii TaxID=2053833 RepID=A0A364NZ24_9PROT|nr:PilZ domain-containing protein [Paramagnetospirillum kuznetsovii]RAU22167.1 PilZ domain-containing protein [Paramagnetospirillum kuznetsovii]
MIVDSDGRQLSKGTHRMNAQAQPNLFASNGFVSEVSLNPKFFGKDRRRHSRRFGDGMVVVIDNRIFPIFDISVSGIRFQCAGGKPGDKISLRVARLQNMSDFVDCQAIVRHADETSIRAEFIPTFRLMKFLLGHFGEINGTSPVFFK